MTYTSLRYLASEPTWEAVEFLNFQGGMRTSRGSSYKRSVPMLCPRPYSNGDVLATPLACRREARILSAKIHARTNFTVRSNVTDGDAQTCEQADFECGGHRDITSSGVLSPKMASGAISKHHIRVGACP